MSRNSSFLLSNEGQFPNQAQLQHHHHQQQNNQPGGGLARYRSAPSSFLAALLDPSTDNSSSGEESEALFSALMDGPRDLGQKGGGGGGNQMHYEMKQETGVDSATRPGLPVGGQMGYESAVSGAGGVIVGSYSVGMDLRNGSNLVRQSSSPAGFFNGYGIMGEAGNYRDSKASSSAAMSNHMNFSSAPSSCSRFMPSIPENVNETRSPDQLGRASAREFEAVFPPDSWNGSNFNTLKRSRDDDDDEDDNMFSDFNGLENQNGERRKSHHGLVHHLSLPKTSSEMAEVEKFLQFQPDTVPCQIRAKRGCATHPRSIAERMRRTRISEKMKKLQDLFPNMDKQTSTADMLDLAVQFIKDLQKQVDTLTETKARCVCSNKPQQTSPNS